LPEAAAARRPAGVTVRDAIARGAARLAAAGCETPRLDAELLLASALGVGRGRLVIEARSELAGAELSRFLELLTRREAREPVAYITGSRAFRRLSLAVDRRVLIPRPETELLVEVGLSLAEGLRVLDVGTGSGAVALAVKDERPDLRVVASDLSADALAVARDNAASLGLDVTFVQADLLDGVPGSFDAVLSNLPYVCDGAVLAPEIAAYEPALALYAGADGLDVVRRLVASLGTSVELVGLEVGFDQAAAVAGLLAGAGFSGVWRRRDLAGHERVVVGRR
jgi:release factor glutamine methyltransferase